MFTVSPLVKSQISGSTPEAQAAAVTAAAAANAAGAAANTAGAAAVAGDATGPGCCCYLFVTHRDKR